MAVILMSSTHPDLEKQNRMVHFNQIETMNDSLAINVEQECPERQANAHLPKVHQNRMIVEMSPNVMTVPLA